ncbi:MAG: GTPase HflX, partial [Clostridia bacterium]|nr:GTPase HflX [Clostridia bacterium]
DQMRVTEELARELCEEGTPTIYVFTKCDLAPIKIPSGENRISISSVTGEGLEDLRELIRKKLDSRSVKFETVIPYDKAGALDMLYKNAVVSNVDYGEDGIRVEGKADPKVYGQLAKLLGKR